MNDLKIMKICLYIYSKSDMERISLMKDVFLFLGQLKDIWTLTDPQNNIITLDIREFCCLFNFLDFH